MHQARFDYDGPGKLIVCSEGQEVIGHDGGDEAPLWLFRAEQPVVALAITAGGVVVADKAGVLVTLGRERGEEFARRALDDELGGLATGPDGSLAALGAKALILELPGRFGQHFPALAGACCAAFSADGSRLAVGHADGHLRVLRLPSGELLGEHQLEGPLADVCAGADGWLVAAGDRVMRVVPDGTSSKRLTGMSDSAIGSVLMRQDGRLLGLAIRGRLVMVLHYPSLETIASIEYLDKEVTNLAFGPHPWLGVGLSGGDGNKVNLFTGAMHRTDTHPEREHHSWMLSQSIVSDTAKRLLGDGAPTAAPPAARPPAAAPRVAPAPFVAPLPPGRRDQLGWRLLVATLVALAILLAYWLKSS